MRSHEVYPQSSQPLESAITEFDISSEQPERQYTDTPTGTFPLQSQSDTPMEASLRRSQRSNFGVPPIRWGACGVINLN